MIVGGLFALWQDEPGPITDATNQVTGEALSLREQLESELPLVGFALVILLVGYVVMRILRRGLRRGLQLRYTDSVAIVSTRFFGWVFMAVVALVALAITFPSINAADVIGSLGFVSVAVGFAFKDILENSLAGLLLLIRKPFKLGDQIEVVEIFGTVEEISIRETRIRQRNGEIIIIPNRDVYKNNIRVQTERPLKRFEFYLEFDYTSQVGGYIDTIVAAIGEVEGVAADPPPKGRVDKTDPEMLVCKFMGWAKSDQSSFNDCRNRSIQHVIAVMEERNIPIPNDIHHLETIDRIAPPTDNPQFEL